MRLFPLGQEPLLDDRDVSTVEERLLQMAQLSRRAHELSGRSLPTYCRENMPGKVLRRGKSEHQRME